MLQKSALYILIWRFTEKVICFHGEETRLRSKIAENQ